MRKKLLAILQNLGFAARVQAKEELSQTEWDSVCAAYRDAYGTELADDISQADAAGEETAPAMSQEQLDGIYAILGNDSNGAEEPGAVAETTNPVPAATAHTAEDLAARVQTVIQENVRLRQENREMSARTVEDLPEVTGHTILSINGPGTNPNFLFGIEHPMFSMNNRWNRITNNPRYAANNSYDEDEVTRQFYTEASSFGKSMAKRFAYLNENHLMDPDKLATGEFSTTYQGVTDAKVGDQYVVRRQDALIARVLKKRDLTQFFPVRYGIQDHDLVFNTFFTEVSQAYQTGEIWKGSMSIENEMGHVDDLMIKMKWGPMKELERKYIAYLNKEGSDPIKWSMIEWAILNSLETAQVEQNKRRMRGIYVKPETGVAGSYLNASTGIIYTLLRYHHEHKIKLHDDSDFRTYTSSTMLDTVRAFVKDVKEDLSEDMDLDNHVIYLNKLHKQWWIDCCRTKYGKDLDFSGPDSYANIVPDTEVRIIWLPYMGKMKLMFMDIPGNLQFLEFVPGEMLAIKAKDDMELVKAWSTWKEGCAAAFTGKHFSTKSAMDANNYDWQQIFMNKPAATLADGATSADADNGFWFVSSANTADTALTGISNAKDGVAYIIECGSTTHKTTIAKSGDFANLTAAWTPTAVGDYLMVILDSNDKYRELERCVGGTRTVNSNVQPNLPGVR